MTNLTLDEKKELIRMALKAREGAYVPYSDLWWARRCGPRMAASSPAATWRMPPSPPPVVPSARRCSRPSAEGVTKFTDIAVVGAAGAR